MNDALLKLFAVTPSTATTQSATASYLVQKHFGCKRRGGFAKGPRITQVQLSVVPFSRPSRGRDRREEGVCGAGEIPLHSGS